MAKRFGDDFLDNYDDDPSYRWYDYVLGIVVIAAVVFGVHHCCCS